MMKKVGYFLSNLYQKNDRMDKKSYAFGMSVASSFYQQGIRVKNIDDFVAGLKAMLGGEKPAISLEEAGEALEAFYKELEDEAAERNAAAGAAAKEEGEKFLANMKGPCSESHQERPHVQGAQGRYRP